MRGLMMKRKLISPSAACSLISHHFTDPAAARPFLLKYASSGAIYVSAEKTFAPDKLEAPNKRIPARKIREEMNGIADDFWNLGSWDSDDTQYFGIQFDETDVTDVAAKHAPSSPGIATPRPPLVGGRPSAKHGEPIASLTLRYMAIPRAELNRLTGVALEQELKKEYNDRGWGAPSQQNRESICVGIIKAIKQHQDKPE